MLRVRALSYDICVTSTKQANGERFVSVCVCVSEYIYTHISLCALHVVYTGIESPCPRRRHTHTHTPVRSVICSQRPATHENSDEVKSEKNKNKRNTLCVHILSYQAFNKLHTSRLCVCVCFFHVYTRSRSIHIERVCSPPVCVCVPYIYNTCI